MGEELTQQELDSLREEAAKKRRTQRSYAHHRPAPKGMTPGRVGGLENFRSPDGSIAARDESDDSES